MRRKTCLRVPGTLFQLRPASVLRAQRGFAAARRTGLHQGHTPVRSGRNSKGIAHYLAGGGTAKGGKAGAGGRAALVVPTVMTAPTGRPNRMRAPTE
jgi:hypothetical protein